MVAVSGSHASTAAGSSRDSTTKASGPVGALELSEEHARWLESVRKLPCELAAEMGIVSWGKRLVFEYRRQGEHLRLVDTTPGSRRSVRADTRLLPEGWRVVGLQIGRAGSC